jgi:hypothetical protein
MGLPRVTWRNRDLGGKHGANNAGDNPATFELSPVSFDKNLQIFEESLSTGRQLTNSNSNAC